MCLLLVLLSPLLELVDHLCLVVLEVRVGGLVLDLLNYILPSHLGLLSYPPELFLVLEGVETHELLPLSVLL